MCDELKNMLSLDPLKIKNLLVWYVVYNTIQKNMDLNKKEMKPYLNVFMIKV